MKIRHIAAAVVLAGGTVAGVLAGAPAAGASEITCQIQNGCGTLHGIDAVGTPVALDAKKKADLGIDIAFPDVAGDRATAFSLVEHQGHGRWTYTDKSASVTGQSSIENLNVVVSAITGELTFTATGTPGNTYSVALSGVPALPSTLDLVGSPASSTFIGSTPFPAYLHPGTYTVNVTLTTTVPANATSTVPVVTTTTGTFSFTVTGSAVYTPAQPYYTIVYVTENGTWTSDCVTALPGGLLANEPCDWGRSPDQQFRFYTSNGGVLSTGSVVVPQAVSSQQYAVENGATEKYLESLSGLLPAQLLVPQSDAADAMPFTGRQLDVNGPSSAVWEFSS